MNRLNKFWLMPVRDNILNRGNEHTLSLTDWPEDSLSEDYLLGRKIILFQPKQGFRVSIDAVFMAAAVPAKKGQRIFEAGSGSGAAALCLAQRVADIQIVGIEILPEMVSLASYNIRVNGKAEHVTVINGDITGLQPPNLYGVFDHAMVNPPFLKDTDGNLPKNPIKARAKTLSEYSLADWISGICMNIKRRGTITMIWRADRLDFALTALHKEFGEICLFPFWPKLGKSAKRVLIRARKGVKSPMKLSAGLTVHKDTGEYTCACESVLKYGQPLVF